MNLEVLMSDRMSMPQIKSVAEWASGNRGNILRLWAAVGSENVRISLNALWALSHLPDSDSLSISGLRNDMIEMLLKESHPGKKRMLLRLLRDLEYEKEEIRSDFLDFCLSKINSECEPYAVRCFSLYVAFKMCRHYPELIAELENYLEMLSFQSLSPGLQSAVRQTRSKIKKLCRGAGEG